MERVARRSLERRQAARAKSAFAFVESSELHQGVAIGAGEAVARGKGMHREPLPCPRQTAKPNQPLQLGEIRELPDFLIASVSSDAGRVQKKVDQIFGEGDRRLSW